MLNTRNYNLPKFRIFSLVILVFFTTAFKHPFYLGVVDLKYNASQKKIQGSIKLFINDFEMALKKIEHKTIDLINIKNEDEVNKIVSNYLNSHLTITVNGQKSDYTLIGFEREQEAFWMYVELEKTPIPKKIEVYNTLLYDLKEQMNILHIEVNDVKKSMKLNNPEKYVLFNF